MLAQTAHNACVISVPRTNMKRTRAQSATASLRQRPLVDLADAPIIQLPTRRRSFMVARKRLFGASVAQVLLVVLLATQAVMMVNACVLPMPDFANGRCPSGPCDGLSEHVCRTAY